MFQKPHAHAKARFTTIYLVLLDIRQAQDSELCRKPVSDVSENIRTVRPMNIILASTSARAVYQTALPHQVVGDPDQCDAILADAVGTPALVRSVIRDHPFLADAAEVLAARLDAGEGEGDKPAGVLVGSDGARFRSNEMDRLFWRGQLPGGSLWHIPDLDGLGINGVYCVSPEMHLVLRSRKLALPDASKLAMELCGYYDYPFRTGDSMVSRRKPLTTKAQLTTFIDSIDRDHHGVPRAKRAADFAIDGSASPRESALALFLSMGTRLGGMGLPKPLLNQPLEVPAHCQALLDGQRTIRFDLYWPEFKLAIEYDSQAYHQTTRQIELDKNRLAVAQNMGIQLVTATPSAVRNLGKMEPLLRTIFLRIKGREPWNVSLNIREKREALRKALFSMDAVL